MHSREEKLEAFGRFLDVLDTLREKCPWDKKQTNESLRPNTIEETFELCDALMKDDKKNICKELGDVLLQVVLQSQIAADAGEFTIDDVCADVNAKMIRRHPRVFGGEIPEVENEKDLWEAIKKQEREEKKKRAAAH